MPGGRQLRRHIGANADDGGGSAAWSADSGESRPSIARAADEYDIVLVDGLQIDVYVKGQLPSTPLNKQIFAAAGINMNQAVPVVPAVALGGIEQQMSVWLLGRIGQGCTSFASWMNRPALGVEVASP